LNLQLVFALIDCVGNPFALNGMFSNGAALTSVQYEAVPNFVFDTIVILIVDTAGNNVPYSGTISH
jgi:hypothetical protein